MVDIDPGGADEAGHFQKWSAFRAGAVGAQLQMREWKHISREKRDIPMIHVLAFQPVL